MTGATGAERGYGPDVDRRHALSFLLPLVGLAITVPELLRLIDARPPDLVFLVVTAVFGLVFVARLAFLAYEYVRSAR